MSGRLGERLRSSILGSGAGGASSSTSSTCSRRCPRLRLCCPRPCCPLHGAAVLAVATIFPRQRRGSPWCSGRGFDPCTFSLPALSDVFVAIFRIRAIGLPHAALSDDLVPGMLCIMLALFVPLRYRLILMPCVFWASFSSSSSTRWHFCWRRFVASFAASGLFFEGARLPDPVRARRSRLRRRRLWRRLLRRLRWCL